VLNEVGAAIGPIFGDLSDQDVYRALLQHDHAVFIALAIRIATLLSTESCTQVVADPIEGYNPTHDMCRVIADAAVMRVMRRDHRQIRNYYYPLMGCATAPTAHTEDLEFELTDCLLQRKLRAARDYIGLSAEVTRTLSQEGASAQRFELLRVNQSPLGSLTADQLPPYYESYGEQQKAAGHYKDVIRYEQHFLPAVRALHDWAHGDSE
jgi:hypothetical protein